MKKLDTIHSKIMDPEMLQRFLSILKFRGKKIVFTNGCFDILHRGHIDYLSKAADHGNILIIGLNTDNSVKRIKGKNRPVNDEYARAIVLASLHFVDAVVMFDEDTPYNLINAIKPDVLIKGSDWLIEDIVGADIVTNNGGSVITLEYLPGYSTTKIIDKLKSSDY